MKRLIMKSKHNARQNNLKLGNLKRKTDKIIKIGNPKKSIVKKLSKVHKDKMFNDNTNYFNLYWDTWKENEYNLARIKEILFEIESMKSYIYNLSKHSEQ